MKLHITKIQEFRNSPTDPSVYEITGDIPSGFGRPEISAEYELVAPGRSQETNRSGVGTRAAASPETESANSPSKTSSPPALLGKQGDLMVRCTPQRVYESSKGENVRLVVEYFTSRQEGGKRKAYRLYLSCWDAALFDAVKATEKQEAEFSCTEVERNGTKFVNIVGLKVGAEAARA